VQVSGVMTRAVVAESPAESLRSAASRMWGKQTGSLLVVSGDELLGIVTERDVMRAVAKGLDVERTPVSAIMTTAVVTVSPDDAVTEAAAQMSRRWIRHLPVVAGGKVVGVVSSRDLVGLLGGEAGAPPAGTAGGEVAAAVRDAG
jgi:CBS domain-containing protein